MDLSTNDTFNKVRVTGSWSEITSALEDVQRSLSNNEFDEWRPEQGESLSDEQRDKTAEQSSGNTLPVPVKTVEKTIYKHVMIPFNKHYFSCSDAEATLDEKQGKYEAEVYIDDSETYEDVKQEAL